METITPASSGWNSAATTVSVAHLNWTISIALVFYIAVKYSCLKITLFLWFYFLFPLSASPKLTWYVLDPRPLQPEDFHHPVQQKKWISLHSCPESILFNLLTAFENETQQTDLSKSPMPMTWRVCKLTEFQMRIWGWKHNNKMVKKWQKQRVSVQHAAIWELKNKALVTKSSYFKGTSAFKHECFL